MFLTNTKLEEIVGLAAQAIGTALEKKVSDTVQDIKNKVQKRLRAPSPEELEEEEYYDSKKTQVHYPKTYSVYQTLGRTYRKKRRSKYRRN